MLCFLHNTANRGPWQQVLSHARDVALPLLTGMLVAFTQLLAWLWQFRDASSPCERRAGGAGGGTLASRRRPRFSHRRLGLGPSEGLLQLGPLHRQTRANGDKGPPRCGSEAGFRPCAAVLAPGSGAGPRDSKGFCTFEDLLQLRTATQPLPLI